MEPEEMTAVVECAWESEDGEAIVSLDGGDLARGKVTREGDTRVQILDLVSGDVTHGIIR